MKKTLQKITLGIICCLGISYQSLGANPVITNLKSTIVDNNNVKVEFFIDWKGETPTVLELQYSASKDFNAPFTTYSDIYTVQIPVTPSNFKSVVFTYTSSSVRFYRIRAKNSNNEEVYTPNDNYFTREPYIRDIENRRISNTDATVSFNIDWGTSTPKNLILQYAQGTSYNVAQGFKSVSLNANQNGRVTTTITGLAVGTIYYYRILAQSNNYSDYYTSNSENQIYSSNPVSSPTLSNVASTVLSTTSAKINFNVNWNNLTPAGLSVQYSTNKTFISNVLNLYLQTNTSGNRDTTITNLIPGTLYYYRVYANAGGQNEMVSSNYNSFTLPTAPSLGVTYATVLSPTSAQIDYSIFWNKTTPSSFVLQADTSSNFNSSLLSAKNLSFTEGAKKDTLKGLLSNAQYYYRIIENNNYTTSQTVASSFKLTSSPIVSGVVTTKVNSNNFDLSFSLNWNAGTPKTLLVEYSTDSSFTNAVLTKTLTANQSGPIAINISGLIANTKYYYKVKATNSANEIVISEIKNFTTVTAVLITGLSATKVTNTNVKIDFNIDWNGIVPQWLTVTYSTDSTFSTNLGYKVLALDAGAKTTNVILTAGGTKMYYRVDANYGQTYSETKSFQTAGAPSITGQTATEIGNISAKISFNLNWNGSIPSQLYIEYGTNQYLSSSKKLILNIESGNIDSTITGLASGAYNYYRVVAKSSDGYVFATDIASFITQQGPYVTIASSSVTATTATVKWNLDWRYSTIGTMKIQYDTTNTFSSPTTVLTNAGVTPGNGTYIISNLTTGTTYYYRFIATSTDAGSFTTVTNTVKPVGPPKPDNFVATTLSSTSVKIDFDLNWNGSTPGTVNVQYSQLSTYNGTSYGIQLVPTSSTNGTKSVTLTGLTTGVKYYYRVWAQSAGIPDVITSNTANTFFITPLPTFTNMLASGASGTSIAVNYNLSWNTATPTSVKVEYATTPDFTGDSFQTKNLSTTAGNRSDTITGLITGTTYYIRLIAKNSENGETIGFRLAAKAQSAPKITLLTATPLSNTTAKIDFNFDWNGSTPGFTVINVSTTTDYQTSASVPIVPTNGANSIALDQSVVELKSGQKYYYSIIVTSPGLNNLVTDRFNNFTLFGDVPIVNNVSATVNADNSVNVNYYVANNAYTGLSTGVVEYNTTNDFSGSFLSNTGDALSEDGNRTNVLNGLTGETTYYYRVRLTYNGLNVYSTTIDSFKTRVLSGIESENTSQSTVYPNPAKDIVHVSGFSEILTLSGNKVAEGTETIDVSGLNLGVYIVKTGSITSKLIKE